MYTSYTSQITYVRTHVQTQNEVTIWYGMVWYGMVWYGMVWYGVWYGMTWMDNNTARQN